MYKLFMEFENPTEGFTGKKETTQGFAVHGDLGFVLYHTGVCGVYDLAKRNKVPVDVFKLGSYNFGVPDRRYTNHANDAMFGGRLPEEEFPLLYVTAGNSGESDENGYIGYCAVEQIRLENGFFRSQLQQRIFYRNDGIEKTPYQSPGWGWPASLVDVEGGWYYMLSARYRTKKEFSKPDNVYIITKFQLPNPKIGDVTLYPSDIVEQFELPLDTLFTQGGTIRDEKLWFLFGCGTKDYPDALRVIDLKAREYALREDLSQTEFCQDEVECCAFYGEDLLINTQKGKLYMRY